MTTMHLRKSMAKALLFTLTASGISLASLASGDINPVGGFEIGNGMVVNRIGGYRFKLPGNWEIGESGGLTQVIAPIKTGIPRPLIQVDVIRNEASQFTDLGDGTTDALWIETRVGSLPALTRTARSENGLIRSEFKIRKSNTESFLVTLDFGVASNNAELHALLDRSLASFQKSEMLADN